MVCINTYKTFCNRKMCLINQICNIIKVILSSGYNDLILLVPLEISGYNSFNFIRPGTGSQESAVDGRLHFACKKITRYGFYTLQHYIKKKTNENPLFRVFTRFVISVLFSIHYTQEHRLVTITQCTLGGKENQLVYIQIYSDIPGTNSVYLARNEPGICFFIVDKTNVNVLLFNGNRPRALPDCEQG